MFMGLYCCGFYGFGLLVSRPFLASWYISLAVVTAMYVDRTAMSKSMFLVSPMSLLYITIDSMRRETVMSNRDLGFSMYLDSMDDITRYDENTMTASSLKLVSRNITRTSRALPRIYPNTL